MKVHRLIRDIMFLDIFGTSTQSQKQCMKYAGFREFRACGVPKFPTSLGYIILSSCLSVVPVLNLDHEILTNFGRL